jgi:hypothetical protein
MLYDWAAPGSVMALSYGDVQTSNPQAQVLLENFKRNSAQIYMRDEAQVRALMAPWKVRESQPLASWLGVEHLIDESIDSKVGAQMYGVMLVHEE